MLLVLVRPEELLGLALILEAEADHPAVAVRIGVHESGLLVEALVDGDDFAAQGGEELRDGLHRLDRAEDVHAPEGVADLRQLDVHDVAELSLRVVGDPDLHDVRLVGALDVLVLFAVQQVAGNVAHALAPNVGRREVYRRAEAGVKETRPASRSSSCHTASARRSSSSIVPTLSMT